MNCAQCREHIVDLVDGRLSAEDEAAVRDALGRCEDCRHEYEELRALVDDLGRLPALEPPPELGARLVEAFRAEVAGRPAIPVREPGLLERLGALRLAAGFAAAIFAVWAIGREIRDDAGGDAANGRRPALVSEQAQREKLPRHESTIGPHPESRAPAPEMSKAPGPDLDLTEKSGLAEEKDKSGLVHGDREAKRLKIAGNEKDEPTRSFAGAKGEGALESQAPSGEPDEADAEEVEEELDEAIEDVHLLEIVGALDAASEEDRRADREEAAEGKLEFESSFLRRQGITPEGASRLREIARALFDRDVAASEAAALPGATEALRRLRESEDAPAEAGRVAVDGRTDDFRKRESTKSAPTAGVRGGGKEKAGAPAPVPVRREITGRSFLVQSGDAERIAERARAAGRAVAAQDIPVLGEKRHAGRLLEVAMPAGEVESFLAALREKDGVATLVLATERAPAAVARASLATPPAPETNPTPRTAPPPGGPPVKKGESGPGGSGPPAVNGRGAGRPVPGGAPGGGGGGERLGVGGGAGGALGGATGAKSAEGRRSRRAPPAATPRPAEAYAPLVRLRFVVPAAD
ncbi:MAG: zf-HC2 domain-containing protein [Planctomycetota bacterium]